MDWWASVLLLLTRGAGADQRLDPCAALALLDAQRAVAYAVADPDLLDVVYAEASSVGTTDREILADYAERDLRVAGASMEILSCRVAWRAGAEVDLSVTDRLGRAVALEADGARDALPRDKATSRTIRLVAVDGRWRIG